MAMMTARNTMGTPALGTKKPRKAYTISRPREKWTADEHERFVHALLIFGRDWKTIEQFVGTKAATQIRSHAQKYFLKAHKQGLAAVLPPAPHPRRGAAVLQNAGAASCASLSGARVPAHDELFMSRASSGGASPSEEVALLHPEDTFQLPLSPDDLRFAEVYRFVADVFGSGATWPVEAQLQRLHGVEPVVAETILLVLWNLEETILMSEISKLIT
ncbi:hypothetical protein EJB05_33411, partial [Eragrostis curvula]